jgi:hypothetical protein
MRMKTTYQLDQLELFTAIARAISKQAPRLPADNRANVVIEAANMIVAAYALTDAEYMEQKANAPIEVDLQPTEAQIEAGIAQLRDCGVDVDARGLASFSAESAKDTLVFVWQAMIGARDK